MGATWPLVRLDQYSWGIRIGPRVRFVTWLLPTTDLPWSEILVVRRVWGGLAFTRRSGTYRWVTFGPVRDERLTYALQQHGVDLRR